MHTVIVNRVKAKLNSCDRRKKAQSVKKIHAALAGGRDIIGVLGCTKEQANIIWTIIISCNILEHYIDSFINGSLHDSFINGSLLLTQRVYCYQPTVVPEQIMSSNSNTSNQIVRLLGILFF